MEQPRPDRWSYENWVGAEEFRSQLRWLKQVLEPVDLAGLARWQQGNFTGRKGPLLITFDDGYRNNLTVAAPILKAEGVPAVFFLATGYIGTTRTLWNDEVRLRVLAWPESEIRMPSGETVAVPQDLTARRALADLATQTSKRLTEQPCAGYMSYLRAKTPGLNVMDDAEARAFMNWDEARQLAAMGFEIGAHTVEHPILSMIGRERIASEVKESKAAIERELGKPCTAIAYPNGSARDVNDVLFEEVRGAGYDWAFMTTPLWQSPGGDPHRIARVCFPGHTDLATFKFYSSGLYHSLSRAA